MLAEALAHVGRCLVVVVGVTTTPDSGLLVFCAGQVSMGAHSLIILKRESIFEKKVSVFRAATYCGQRPFVHQGSNKRKFILFTIATEQKAEFPKCFISS